MKYLESSFSVSMSIPDKKARPQKRKNPRKSHKYVNYGAMCGVCGLDRLAKVHK